MSIDPTNVLMTGLQMPLADAECRRRTEPGPIGHESG